MEGLFMEKHNMKQGALPVDFNLAAVTGSRVKLDSGFKLAIKCSFGDSVGAAFNITLQQHDAAAAGNSKALDFKANYYHKVGLATSFTKVEIRPDDAVATSSVDGGALFAADEGYLVFDVLPEHLDRANGFGWLSCNISAAGAAKIVALDYIVHDTKQKPSYSISL